MFEVSELSAYPATVLLIAANIAASVYAFSNPAFMEKNLFHVGPILRGREWSRVFTSGFLHGGMLHLFVNMYVLWGFGRAIEGLLGSPRFLFIYVAALAGGSLWSLLENKNNLDYRALGASGATSGVILSVCLFAPFMMLGFFFIPMPAVVFAVIFIVASAFLAQRQNKVIAHEAHLGGALAGILATILVEPRALAAFSTQVSQALGGG
ncbi:MAG: rhomboid family intramembrane serine protease [Henriciella sp.]|nr:rhomboid family intramembrane serine protease [Henriciella sp.]